MKTTHSTYIEKRISRLISELNELDEHFYGKSTQKDRDQFAGMLERKRDDVVRAEVLQLQTAIEDILNLLIVDELLEAKSENRSRKLSTKCGRALNTMLYGSQSIGFNSKIKLACSLRIITPKVAVALEQLNTLRNKCSHNWILNAVVRRGKNPKIKKVPLLNYKGRNLHKVLVLKEFLDYYATIYIRLFMKLVK